WRKNTKFAGATEIGPLMPKIATWNLSPGLTESASTTRLGMLKPWIVAGLVMPARHFSINPNFRVIVDICREHRFGASSFKVSDFRRYGQVRAKPEKRHFAAAAPVG